MNLREYFPGAVNHISLRRSCRLVEVFKFAVVIVNREKTKFVFTYKLLVGVIRVVITHGYNGHLVSHAFLQELQVGNFLDARRAPGSPEIQNDNLATIVM